MLSYFFHIQTSGSSALTIFFSQIYFEILSALCECLQLCTNSTLSYFKTLNLFTFPWSINLCSLWPSLKYSNSHLMVVCCYQHSQSSKCSQGNLPYNFIFYIPQFLKINGQEDMSVLMGIQKYKDTICNNNAIKWGGRM